MFYLLCLIIIIKYAYVRQYKHGLEEYGHENQQILPYLKCHIELLEHFEDLELSLTLSHPCSPKNELNNPGSHVNVFQGLTGFKQALFCNAATHQRMERECAGKIRPSFWALLLLAVRAGPSGDSPGST